MTSHDQVLTDEELRAEIVRYLRIWSTPASLGSLSAVTETGGQPVSRALVELCQSGPVVAIEMYGECLYALEWGVRHESELKVVSRCETCSIETKEFGKIEGDGFLPDGDPCPDCDRGRELQKP